MTRGRSSRTCTRTARRRCRPSWHERRGDRLVRAALHGRARRRRAQIPWDRGEAHPLLRGVDGGSAGLRGEGRRALVVGAGLGFDAEHLAALGFATTAFDVAPTAVAWRASASPAARSTTASPTCSTSRASGRARSTSSSRSSPCRRCRRSCGRPATAAIASTVAPGGTLFVVSGDPRRRARARPAVAAHPRAGRGLRGRRPGARAPRPRRRSRARPASGAGSPCSPRPGGVAARRRGHPPSDGAADRGLRADRRHADRGAGRPRRLDRLALPAALRLAGAASRRCWATSRTGAGCSRPTRGHAHASAATATARWCSRPTSTPTAGVLQVVDSMPIRDEAPDVVRVARCLEGRVPCGWSSSCASTSAASCRGCGAARTAGSPRSPVPDAVHLIPGRPTRGRDLTTVAEFELDAGRGGAVRAHLVPVARAEPRPSTASPRRRTRRAWWEEWSGARARSTGAHGDLVRRSLITLKALTYAPTGGIVAAPTTSLPEQIGGVRNWDYRFCWVRDATLTLQSLMHAGYIDEARAWRDWLLRAVAGSPDGDADHVRAGGRAAPDRAGARLAAGLRGLAPGAHRQRRLRPVPARRLRRADGRAAPGARGRARRPSDAAWRLQLALLDFLEGAWDEPDEGIWEVRGERRHFIHSKVMAWVAFDRAVRTVEQLRRTDGPVERWRALRDRIHGEVCERGFDAERGTFTQSYGSRGLDAATLMIPLVGFLPPDDPRVVGTVEAIQRELMRDGFVLRYDTDGGRRRPAAGRGRVPALLVLARRLPDADRPPRRGRASCSTGSPAWPTTSACSRRSTTRAGPAGRATSRRRSRTSGSSTPR